jgi:hypothetical protein
MTLMQRLDVEIEGMDVAALRGAEVACKGYFARSQVVT